MGKTKWKKLNSKMRVLIINLLKWPTAVLGFSSDNQMIMVFKIWNWIFKFSISLQNLALNFFHKPEKILFFQANKSRFLENCHGLFFPENLNLLQISAKKKDFHGNPRKFTANWLLSEQF